MNGLIQPSNGVNTNSVYEMTSDSISPGQFNPYQQHQQPQLTYRGTITNDHLRHPIDYSNKDRLFEMESEVPVPISTRIQRRLRRMKKYGIYLLLLLSAALIMYLVSEFISIGMAPIDYSGLNRLHDRTQPLRHVPIPVSVNDQRAGYFIDTSYPIIVVAEKMREHLLNSTQHVCGITSGHMGEPYHMLALNMFYAQSHMDDEPIPTVVVPTKSAQKSESNTWSFVESVGRAAAKKLNILPSSQQPKSKVPVVVNEPINHHETNVEQDYHLLHHHHGTRDDIIVMINPKITEVKNSGKTTWLEVSPLCDGPRVKRERQNEIEVTYLDHDVYYTSRTIKLNKKMAQCMLHLHELMESDKLCL